MQSVGQIRFELLFKVIGVAAENEPGSLSIYQPGSCKIYTHRSFHLDEKPIFSFLDLVDVGEHLITCNERNGFRFCNN